MKIKRRSPFTGKWHEADLPVTEEQNVKYLNGAMLQSAYPNLSDEQREFIKTGYTPGDWAKIFGGKVPDSNKDYVECEAPAVVVHTIQGWEK